MRIVARAPPTTMSMSAWMQIVRYDAMKEMYAFERLAAVYESM